MKPLSAITAILFAVLPSIVLAHPARDEQWIYRDRTGDASPRPLAVMLSWDYSDILFVASCDAAEQRLRIRHPAAFPTARPNLETGRLRFERSMPMALVGNGRRIEALTALENDASELVGIFPVTAELVALLAITGDDELMIDVENETSDPWFAGRAEPLHRLVRDCHAAR